MKTNKNLMYFFISIIAFLGAIRGVYVYQSDTLPSEQHFAAQSLQTCNNSSDCPIGQYCEIDLASENKYCVGEIAVCGDNLCIGDEIYACPDDCVNICGNTICESDIGEDVNTCPQDCQPTCGDTFCTHDENFQTCPQDGCISACLDGVCDEAGGENSCTCNQDCRQPKCENNLCEYGESNPSSSKYCPADCIDENGGPVGICGSEIITCGNGDVDASDFCDDPTNANYCFEDCTTCGDTICEEHNGIKEDCPDDCGRCDDGYCAQNEDEQSCPQDCQPIPTDPDLCESSQFNCNHLCDERSEAPLDVFFVLDNSSSMDINNRRAILKKASKNIVSFLSTGDRVSIIEFHTEASTRMKLSDNLQFAQDRLDLIISRPPIKLTNYKDAYEHLSAEIALHQSSFEGRKQVVFFVSDGEPTVGGPGCQQNEQPCQIEQAKIIADEFKIEYPTINIVAIGIDPNASDQTYSEDIIDILQNHVSKNPQDYYTVTSLAGASCENLDTNVNSILYAARELLCTYACDNDCGNGQIDPDEQCDSGTGCLPTCMCPDGYIPDGNKGCMLPPQTPLTCYTCNTNTNTCESFVINNSNIYNGDIQRNDTTLQQSSTNTLQSNKDITNTNTTGIIGDSTLKCPEGSYEDPQECKENCKPDTPPTTTCYKCDPTTKQCQSFIESGTTCPVGSYKDPNECTKNCNPDTPTTTCYKCDPTNFACKAEQFPHSCPPGYHTTKDACDKVCPVVCYECDLTNELCKEVQQAESCTDNQYSDKTICQTQCKKNPPPCDTKYGKQCSITSLPNQCGATNTTNGTYDCSGTCIAPNPTVPTTPVEICNGKDDNCNGTVDETFACIQGSANCSNTCECTSGYTSNGSGGCAPIPPSCIPINLITSNAGTLTCTVKTLEISITNANTAWIYHREKITDPIQSISKGSNSKITVTSPGTYKVTVDQGNVACNAISETIHIINDCNQAVCGNNKKEIGEECDGTDGLLPGEQCTPTCFKRCPRNTTYCPQTNSCTAAKECPDTPPCNNDGVCTENEDCRCSDCGGKQDSCQEGLICNTVDNYNIIDPKMVCYTPIAPYCGDGVVQTPNGSGFNEQCDHGTTNNNGSTIINGIVCTNRCEIVRPATSGGSTSFGGSVPSQTTTVQPTPTETKPIKPIIKKAPPALELPKFIEALPLVLPKTGTELLVYIILGGGLAAMFGATWYYYRKKEEN